jgi:hypothetical protein
MKTAGAPTHRHTFLGKGTSYAGDHVHALPDVDTEIDALWAAFGESVIRLAKAEARITALETPVVDPPPVDPPPAVTPAFLARPARQPFAISDATDVELSGFAIRGGVIGVTLRRCRRVWIHDIDLADLVGGIYASECEDVVVEDVRGRNIGDNTIGSGHSNYVQFAETRGGAIRRCRFLGGLTEDMISTWHSGGWDATRPLLIEDNALQGLLADTPEARAWTRTSGTGIIVSDGGGDDKNGWVTVRRNTLLSPGQVGIQLIDGPGIRVHENTVYGERNPRANVGMSSWEGRPLAEVYGNRVRWYKPDGSENPRWWGYGTVNEHDNDWHADIDPAALRVVL